MVRPTDAEVKEFWGKLSVKPTRRMSQKPVWASSDPDDLRPPKWIDGGYVDDYPPIDLNSLFKYAVPRVSFVRLTKTDHHSEYVVTAVDYGLDKEAKAFDKDPALALFWACYPIITGKEVADE